MGVAAQDYSGDGRPDLFVTNSRGQGHAAFQATAGSAFSNVRSVFAPAVGPDATGWGDTWVDLSNDGRLDLVLANGAIPVTNLTKDAAALQILANVKGRFANVSPTVGLHPGPLVNGRGVAAADYDNDGRMDIAVNSIGGKLILLHNTGALGTLARGAPGAVRARRARDRRAPGRHAARPRGPGREQLPLVRGPARALRSRRGDEGEGADRPLAGRQGHARADVAADRIVTVAP